MNAILRHVRRQIVGYVALVIALGGTSYAAVSLPNGSVTAATLNRHSIGGYVLASAHVNSNGHVLSGSPGAVVVFTGSQTSPLYFVRWNGVSLPARCGPVATIAPTGSGQSGVTSIFTSFSNYRTRNSHQVNVSPRDATGRLVTAEFYLAVIC